jgi:hypothetical protein
VLAGSCSATGLITGCHPGLVAGLLGCDEASPLYPEGVAGGWAAEALPGRGVAANPMRLATTMTMTATHAAHV